MITKGAKVLVIAAIDGTTLTDALQQAADAGIKVIAYDRLIRDTPNVDYYATFDNFQVGVLQASRSSRALGLKDGAQARSTSSCSAARRTTTTPSSSTTARCRVLQPYIDSGKLVVASGQTGMDKVGTLRWDGAAAQARMDNLLTAHYTDERVDAVLSPYDGLSHRHHLLAEGRRLRRRQADARSSPARTPRCRRSSRSSRASRPDRLQGHPRPAPRSRVDMVDAVLSTARSRRSTTPRPTTTASRSCRPTC